MDSARRFTDRDPLWYRWLKSDPVRLLALGGPSLLHEFATAGRCRQLRLLVPLQSCSQ